MKALLIELGNTRIKWCLAEDGQLSAVDHAELSDTSPRDLVGRIAPQRNLPVVVASVAAARITAEVEHLIRDRSVEVSRVTYDRVADFLHTDYRRPAQLGIDRWLAALAVRDAGKRCRCVVDAGTAITIDLLDGASHHLGGWILPGIRLQKKALLENTGIPEGEPEGQDDWIGRSTHDAIELASVLAAAALIDRIIVEGGKRLSYGDIDLFLGGGSAPILSTRVLTPHQVIENLVLRGMAMLIDLESA